MSIQNILGYLLWREVQLDMKLLRVDSWSVYEVVASFLISLVHLICNQLSFVVTASFIRHNTDVVTFPLCSVQKSVWVDQFAQLVTISSLPSVTKSLSVRLNIQAWPLFQVSETSLLRVGIASKVFFQSPLPFSEHLCTSENVCDQLCRLLAAHWALPESQRWRAGTTQHLLNSLGGKI